MSQSAQIIQAPIGKGQTRSNRNTRNDFRSNRNTRNDFRSNRNTRNDLVKLAANRARCRVEVLVERRVFVVELDLGHLGTPAPVWLIPEAVFERTLGVLLGDEELYRFRVVKLGQRIQTHGTRRLKHPG